MNAVVNAVAVRMTGLRAAGAGRSAGARGRLVRAGAAAALFMAAAGAAAGPAPARAQAFGGAVLVADGMVLVGEAAHEREPGTVRAFADEGGEWREVAALRAPEPAVRDGFGSALARAGDFLFVGAPRGGSGAVYVYRMADLGPDGAAPVQTLADAALARFGATLAASDGEVAAAGSAGDGGRVVTTFAQNPEGGPAALWAPTGTVSIEAGVRTGADWLDLDGGVLAAGTAETVRVYERDADGTGWELAGELTPTAPEGARMLLPGVSVAVLGGDGSGGAEIVARQTAFGHVQRRVVHRFAKVDGAWTSAGTLSPPDDAASAGGEEPAAPGFGLAVAADGGSLVVAGAGRVVAFRRAGGAWEPAGSIRYSDGGGAGGPSGGQTVAIGGDLVAVGDPSADFGLGAALVLSRASGEWAPAGRLEAEQIGLPAISGGEVACEEGEADLYACDHVDLLSFIPREEIGAERGARLNDVWGWTDPESGREFALVGRMDGASFVEVTDPYNPRYLGNLPRTPGSPASTWRDIKTFRDHAFIVADGAGEHGMQVFALAQLRDVTEPREFEPTAMYTEIASSHNVAINEETGFAYLVGSSGGGVTCGGGSHMVDINDPLNPVFAGCFAHPNTGRRNTGNSHDTQCVIYHGPDEDYRGREICVNSNETALSVADVTDKDAPVAIAASAYPNVQYAHQGWLTEDHRYFYSNDELDEVSGAVEATRTLIWDLADLDDPVLLTEYMNPTRATDHNLYVRGDRLYMSNNRAGLRVLDIADPANPTEIGYFDTTPWSADEAGFDGTWSVYPYFESGSVLLSSRREGLFIVRPRARRLIP